MASLFEGPTKVLRDAGCGMRDAGCGMKLKIAAGCGIRVFFFKAR